MAASETKELEPESGSEAMAWYYVFNGVSHGPVAEADIRSLQAQNVVGHDTLVWNEGMTTWIPLGQSNLAGSGATALAGSAHTCTECGRTFPEDDMLLYDNAWVCAACKPLFFQRLREGVAVRHNLPYASVGRRFVALILDAVFTGVSGIILLWVILVLILIARGNPADQHIHGLSKYVGFLVDLMPVIYEVVMISNYGATFGKMIMKIKVLAPDGSRISYARSTGRYFAKVLSGLILCIGYLMAFWDDEKRALHDYLCETRVFFTRPS